MQSKTRVKSTSKLKLVPPFQLNSCLNKFYTLDQNEKYEEFLIELGTSKDVRVSAINSKPTVMLCLQNNAYVLNTMYPEGKTVRVRFRPGEKAFRRRPGGEIIESRFDLMDNILTEELTVEGFDITVERVFTKKEMLVTMKMTDVECFRKFSVSTSKHSIETETSRRSSICNQIDMLHPQEFESFTEDEFGSESEISNELQICY